MVELHPRWTGAARFSGRWSFGPLIEALGGPDAFESAPGTQLVEAGLPLKIAQAVLGAVSIGDQGCEVTRLGDASYPHRLLDLPKPPPVIWWRGDLARCTEGEGLAVVGSRACTGYGRRLAYRLGGLEAASGGTLISGAARGIDRAAHDGALEYGRTLAVLGGGLNAPMGPTQRNHLDRMVSSGGAVMSEFPPSQTPTRWSFPQRNRLVAALSRAVAVVEAKVPSGAGITAGFARDLGREVYAVPGPLESPTSEGCHRLIAEGARVVVRLSDPIWERTLAGRESLPELLRLLTSGPLTQSELQQRGQMPPRELQRALGQYELAGLVQRLPGARFGLA